MLTRDNIFEFEFTDSNSYFDNPALLYDVPPLEVHTEEIFNCFGGIYHIEEG
ncbi:hypothetical protein C8R27_12240 [Nitrosomonas ureae]|uniref:hypothetical protein n=1 Tax=Nitrosomonas ureae TaxID=44577 RepID=UPI000D8FCD34|nr:hypothetical protein [Nitrosomonas ureae]PXX12846.1 hypothetical protein C8R27_12240 [Nitrosomonas ureae]